MPRRTHSEDCRRVVVEDTDDFSVTVTDCTDAITVSPGPPTPLAFEYEDDLGLVGGGSGGVD